MEVTIAKETESLSCYHAFSAVTIVHVLYKSAICTVPSTNGLDMSSGMRPWSYR